MSKRKVRKLVRKSLYYSFRVSRPPIGRIFIGLRRRVPLRRASSFLRRHPVASFIIVLLILFGLIAASNTILKPKPLVTTQAAPQVKKVQVYTIGSAPRITLQAQVEKSKVIKLTALSPGIIQSINFNEGSFVKRGQTLAVLSTNYQGGNALAISSQIAATQFNNINDTFPTQKDLIQKQRDLANKNADNAASLRDIGNQSIADTQAIIDLNNSMMSTLDTQIKEATSSAASLPLKQSKSGLQAANLQLSTQLRNTQYSGDPNKPLAQIADISKDITLKQLDLQEKGLELSKEIARLSLALAQVTEATMYPAAPFDGTIQRIHVRVGQAVTPGTALVTISGSDANSNLYLKVSQNIATSLSKLEPSTLHLGNKGVDLYPDFISSEATDGQLYVVHFYLPDSWGYNLTDGGYVSVEIPIGYPDTSSSIPFVPIDAIFQSQESSYLFVINKGKAESKEVKLGQVYGRFVQIQSGLTSGDQIILDRSVIASDLVEKSN